MRALITGANSLVNQALLEKLVELGYDLTAHYHTDNDLTKDLKARYPQVRFLQADFSDQASFTAFANAAISGGIHERYDVLVNAAVLYTEADDWRVQKDWEAWQRTFAANVTAAGLLMAQADKAMAKGGVIINVSSTYGQAYMGNPTFTMYSASKAALDSLTAAYAKRWTHIRVVGLAPGWVRSAWNKDKPDEELDKQLEAVLTHQLVEPAEIANLMETVIKNPSINATTLVIDGGLSAPVIQSRRPL